MGKVQIAAAFGSVVGAIILGFMLYFQITNRKEKRIIKKGLETHISYLQKLKKGESLNSLDRWAWQFAGEDIMDICTYKRLLLCEEGVRDANVIGGRIVGSMRHEDFTASFRGREDESIKRAEEVIKKI